MKIRFLVLASAIATTSFSAFAQAMPVPTPVQEGQEYCREYTQKVMIGGVRRDSYGTSCMQPDGSWKIVTTDMQPSPGQPVQYVSPPQYTSPPQYIAVPPAYVVGGPPAYYPYSPYAPVGVTLAVGHGWYHGYGGGYGRWR